jgi:protein TonB
MNRRWHLALAGSLVLHAAAALFVSPLAPRSPVRDVPLIVQFRMLSASTQFAAAAETQASNVAPRRQPRQDHAEQPLAGPVTVDSSEGTVAGVVTGTTQEHGNAGGEPENYAAPQFSAAYLENPPPQYPPAARRRGLQGTVRVNVLVGADGRPREIGLSVSSGVGDLDDAALGAVQMWSFIPARRGGKAVAAWVEVPVRFRLDSL